MAGCMPFRTRISAFKAHVGPIQLPVPIQFAASDNEAAVILRLSSPSAEVAARRPPASRCAVSTAERPLAESMCSDRDYCLLLIGRVMRHS